ncbi:unnamed protein product, partial [Scytosiphon promiscuus]
RSYWFHSAPPPNTPTASSNCEHPIVSSSFFTSGLQRRDKSRRFNMGRICQLVVVALSGMATTVSAGCPFLSGQKAQIDEGGIGGERALRSLAASDSEYHYYPEGGGPDYSQATYEALQADITALLTDSQDFWPADFGHYGGLMIRLAWHCAGNYRQSDGRGGCDGGRIRFNPERSWADNTNLDKALDLLEPLKIKYGDTVSWGDLISLTGNEAIRSMGGPVLGFCAGRQDDASGFASLELGPSPEQEAVAPCAVNGTCESPLGSSTVGLIYVNPEGPLGVPDPAASALDIREVFGRMGMNDSETVALIGGGHAFGKFHGACDTGPGADPMDAPEAPWAGTCGDPDSPTFGRAENTFTSGLEGQWTEEPTVWDNLYFVDLLEYDWVTTESPAGATQWLPVLKEGATETEDEIPDIVMLTTDVALLFDADYLALVENFAEDQDALDKAFAAAWYKLLSRDMGQFERCVGPDVAPPQAFQLPLPSAPAADDLPKYSTAKKSIRRMLSDNPSYGALFVTLAWQCMSTFRSTDYLGGCNGARIRFSPEKDWAVNNGLDEVLDLLAPVQMETPGISHADLIVFAANIA